MNRIEIIKDEESIKVVVIENDEQVEQYVEELQNKRKEGNIYLGRVHDIRKGMGACFVDIAENKKGYLSASESFKSTIEKNSIELNKNEKISNDVKPNAKVLVQIKRDAYNNKGANLTRNIKLPGKYIVLMPYNNFIVVSNKIKDTEKVEKLKENLKEEIKTKYQDNYGVIIRTSAIEVDESLVKKELAIRINEWKRILEEYNNSDDAKILYDYNGIVGKIITDYEEKDFDIYTNDKELIQAIKKHTIKDINYDENLYREIQNKNKIWLKSGGFILIDRTAALVAIDVNSGKCISKKNIEDTIYKVNEEAAIEIAKQIRLNDIGGIIVIDFINMENDLERENIRNKFIEETNKDRSKINVFEFTRLGLLELTRKHIFQK